MGDVNTLVGTQWGAFGVLVTMVTLWMPTHVVVQVSLFVSVYTTALMCILYM